jgi:hypothetical protein
MRIKVYIVTYNNDEILKKCLALLYRSDLIAYKFSIHIINNYKTLKGFEQYKEVSNFEILDNVTRPDFSNGHLSRNWNQALINGFVDLNKPDCDLVVCMQNDTFVKQTCFTKLVEYHKKYDFIQLGVGDQFMSFTPNAIKHIGLFDERFCSIQYQEADYFMAAYTLHRDKISINDKVAHDREWNKIGEVYDTMIEKDYSLNTKHHTHRWSEMHRRIFLKKWNCDPQNWSKYLFTHTPKINIERYFTYPYFEKNILTLKEQNYNEFFENP